MRLFVAIEIDAAVTERIEKIRQRLRREITVPKGSVKWVEPDNTHLTLVFLGDVEDNRVMEVCRIVEQAVEAHAGFDLEIKGLGVFGRPVRVVWAGITENLALKALQHEIQNGFDKAGWLVENREFAGHLTLCRVKIPSAGDVLKRRIEPLRDEPFGGSYVDSVCVFESHLSGGGPTYTVVKRVMLK